MGLHTLIVDDNQDISTLLRDIADMENHDSRVVSTGQDALAALQEGEDFDLIFCDISLPDLSGWEVIDYVRKNNPRTVVAVISGMGNTINNDKLETYQIQHIIQKPFQIDDIQKVFQDVQE